MSDEAVTAPAPVAEPAEKKEEEKTTDTAPAAAEDSAAAAGADADAEPKKDEEKQETAAPTDAEKKSDSAATTETDAKAEAPEKVAEPATDNADAEMKKPSATDAPAAPENDAADAADGDESAIAGEPTTPSADKSKARRKSTGTPAGKKLNKKGSKAKLTNPNAQPGEYYLMKLKGYPQWPVIIADEEMLPEVLLKSRPVSAKRQDGTYREDFADGAKRMNDRTFPIMYLATNEFGWVPNTALSELTSERAEGLLTDSIKKQQLKEAFKLAVEHHDLDHYKDELQAHEQSLQTKAREEQEAKERAAEKKKSSKKRQSVSVAADEDVEMADVADEEPVEKPKSAKKRKAEEAATPQRSDSVKKPKIKLTTSSTPKATNGAATPKSTKDSTKAKPKAKVAEEKKEPPPTAEELHERKSKEVLFLRHKLQKGLLAREGIPKEDEMKGMSEFITKLEAMPDLEVAIIRATKINKVLKAILKLESIPKESEFHFKARSQSLLDKWNKILAADGTAAPAPAANGVNGDADKKPASAPPAEANGVKEDKGEKAAPASVEEAKSEEAAEKPKVDAPAAKEVEIEA